MLLGITVVKNLPADAGDARDTVLILGSGRYPGGGHDNPLQYTCLESSMDRGTWQAPGNHLDPGVKTSSLMSPASFLGFNFSWVHT